MAVTHNPCAAFSHAYRYEDADALRLMVGDGEEELGDQRPEDADALEVVQHRLESEYGVETRLEPMGFQVARWINGGWTELEKVGRIFNCKTVRDAWNRPVLLFKNEWNLNQLQEDHPELELSSVAPVVSGVEPLSL